MKREYHKNQMEDWAWSVVESNIFWYIMEYLGWTLDIRWIKNGWTIVMEK